MDIPDNTWLHDLTFANRRVIVYKYGTIRRESNFTQYNTPYYHQLILAPPKTNVGKRTIPLTTLIKVILSVQ